MVGRRKKACRQQLVPFWGDLPLEIWAEILKYCTQQAGAHLSSTCKLLRALYREMTFGWRQEPGRGGESRVHDSTARFSLLEEEGGRLLMCELSDCTEPHYHYIGDEKTTNFPHYWKYVDVNEENVVRDWNVLRVHHTSCGVLARKAVGMKHLSPIPRSHGEKEYHPYGETGASEAPTCARAFDEYYMPHVHFPSFPVGIPLPYKWLVDNAKTRDPLHILILLTDTLRRCTLPVRLELGEHQESGCLPPPEVNKKRRERTLRLVQEFAEVASSGVVSSLSIRDVWWLVLLDPGAMGVHEKVDASSSTSSSPSSPMVPSPYKDWLPGMHTLEIHLVKTSKRGEPPICCVNLSHFQHVQHLTASFPAARDTLPILCVKLPLNLRSLCGSCSDTYGRYLLYSGIPSTLECVVQDGDSLCLSAQLLSSVTLQSLKHLHFPYFAWPAQTREAVRVTPVFELLPKCPNLTALHIYKDFLSCDRMAEWLVAMPSLRHIEVRYGRLCPRLLKTIPCLYVKEKKERFHGSCGCVRNSTCNCGLHSYPTLEREVHRWVLKIDAEKRKTMEPMLRSLLPPFKKLHV